MWLLVPLFLLPRYVLSCASTSSASSPMTTSTEGATTTITVTSTSTSTTTTTTITTTTTTTLDCPTGWTLFETNCFIFVTTPVNGVTAAQNCANMGTTLASIHSQAENDFIVDITGGVQTWIGIVHADLNFATFQWSDGSAFGPYTNWRPSEPSLLAGEMCGAINVIPGSGTWDDGSCTAGAGPYVCEQPATGG